MPQDHLTQIAIQKGFASFEATLGRVPDNFKLLAEHSPGGFAGYGLMRDAIMRDRDNGGALDLKTKELVFALLDTLIGQSTGAKNHAAAAIRLGLTLPELAEGLVQVIMAGASRLGTRPAQKLCGTASKSSVRINRLRPP